MLIKTDKLLTSYTILVAHHDKCAESHFATKCSRHVHNGLELQVNAK